MSHDVDAEGVEAQAEAAGFWPVPRCAWRRPLGDRPVAASHVREYHTGPTSPDRTKRGVPLGGIGAGNAMFNLCGSFGPWHLKPGRFEERFLSQAAFHVREQVGDGPVTARTLATEDVLPAWPRLTVGDGEYAALFPQGWCRFDAFATAVSLRFFSPVIPCDDEASALPVAVFLLRVHNRQPIAARVSGMFTFPNAPYTDPGQDCLDPLVRQRVGLTNELVTGLVTGAGDAMTAVVLSASQEANPAETAGTAWVIATRTAPGTAAPGTTSAVPNWDGAGDGRAIWRDFAADGRLDPAESGVTGALPAAAIAVEVELAPGETAIVPFILAWEFPTVEFGHGTRWLRRYAEHAVADPGRAVVRAAAALSAWPRWLSQLEAWTSSITEDPTVPDWLKQGALNELYFTTFGGSFWENGCLGQPKRFGARPNQHLHFVLETPQYPYAETFDVRHHVAACYRDLWPSIERDVLLGFADVALDTPDGSLPHDAGSPSGDPWFDYDAYATSYPFAEEGADRRTTPWSEFSPKFIQQVHALWVATGDDVFLDQVWPAVVRTFHYQRRLDRDGDGLPEMKSSEYRGNQLFNAVLWLGALRALVAMATARGDQTVAQQAREVLAKAGPQAERQLWDPDRGYYRYNADVPDLMADALLGERYVDTTGLDPVFQSDRIVSHLRRCWELLVCPLLDTDGDGVGNVGAANLRRPDGTESAGLSEYRHEREVWLGVSYVLAATMVHWGRRVRDRELEGYGLRLGHDLWRTTWAEDTTGYWFGAPEAWDTDDPTHCRVPMYQRVRAIWELLNAARSPLPPV